MAKKGGGWITINGTHVMVDGSGKVVAGPASLRSGSGGKSGGTTKSENTNKSGGSGSSSSGKPATESSLKSMVSGNINTDKPKVESALKDSPIGTKLTFNAYYSSAGQMQDVYEKTGADKWTHSWKVAYGQTYWTTEGSTKVIASEVCNSIYGN